MTFVINNTMSEWENNMKITSISTYTYNKKNRNFHANSSANQPILMQPKHDIFVRKTSQPPYSRVKDGNLLVAVNHLQTLEFDKNDVKYIQSLGIVLPFLNGQEAVDFIRNSEIEVKFTKFSSANTHAQYDYEKNCININEIYKNTQNHAEILAISEAILHEGGHAKDKDGANSIQEELDCLAMNALSHRAFKRTSPNIFENENALIIKDGVCVYADLFFDKDTAKTKLINRLKQKYGDLPAGDINHSPNEIALQVKK